MTISAPSPPAARNVTRPNAFLRRPHRTPPAPVRPESRRNPRDVRPLAMRRSTFRDPLPITVLRTWARFFGTLRQKEYYGVVRRPPYAYGLLRAATIAAYFDVPEITACEFGVAAGDGLVNLIELAGQVTDATGIGVRVYGFDTGEGLPEPSGFRDHPELWSSGDFPMVDRAALLRRIAGRASLLFGDIATTVPQFLQSLDASAPMGFVSMDVDLYSSTRSALGALLGPPDAYLPAVGMYFDDVDFYFANAWCGELAAIADFNATNAPRKIDRDRSVTQRPLQRPWYDRMYICHVLDHPARQTPRARLGATLEEHYRMVPILD
jgi:hypothetical protein